MPVHARGQRPRGACARGQDTGRIRPDVDGNDLFALVNAIGWIVGQAPSIAARRNHLLTLVMDGLGTGPGTGTRHRPVIGRAAAPEPLPDRVPRPLTRVSRWWSASSSCTAPR
ncbi:hypothetical protein [Streptomyces sp. NPDC087297]|uniref:SbtR family transcriptional regulator n=1 Tax=Streptomyces sp. NPDC087297 TaxID=3365778 RepID=UPI00382A940A